MRRAGFLLLLFLSPFIAGPCLAVTMPTYDIDSLVSMSTDVVLATVRDAGGPRTPTILVVKQAIHGRLAPGSVLDRLAPFLALFFPRLSPGQDVILFLDSRPRAPNLFDDAARAPFAIVPSGILPVDRDNRVFRYFQADNPGPYVLEGSERPMQIAMDRVLDAKTKARDEAERADRFRHLLAALPSYDQVRNQIDRSETTVAPLRPLLDRTPTPSDGSILRNLVEGRHPAPVDLDPDFPFDRVAERLWDRIAWRAAEQLETLRDWPDLLDLYPQLGRDGPVAFLSEILASESETLERRIHAAEDIARQSEAVDVSSGNIPGWSRQGPSPAAFLDKIRLSPDTAPHADRIHRTAARIFADDREDVRLRGICARLLDMSAPNVAAAVRRAYASTRSDALRFSIESAMLSFSDTLYEALPGVSGPTTSMTIPAVDRTDTPADKIRFAGAWLQERREWGSPDAAAGLLRYALIDQDTGAERVLGRDQAANFGYEDDSFVLLDRHPALPPGRYLLRLEYVVHGHAAEGYPVHLLIRRSGSRNDIVVR